MKGEKTMAKYVEQKYLDHFLLRECCIHNGWYTLGSNADYDKLFAKLPRDANGCDLPITTNTLYELALDIKAHSDISYYEVPDIMAILARHCDVRFVEQKEAVPTPSPEASEVVRNYFPWRSKNGTQEIMALAKLIGDHNMEHGCADDRFIPYIREVAEKIYHAGYQQHFPLTDPCGYRVNMDSNELLVFLRTLLPRGTKIYLDEMMEKDPFGIPAGSVGTVDHIDDAGQIHCDWDCGSSLAVIPGADRFHVLSA